MSYMRLSVRSKAALAVVAVYDISSSVAIVGLAACARLLKLKRLVGHVINLNHRYAAVVVVSFLLVKRLLVPRCKHVLCQRKVSTQPV